MRKAKAALEQQRERLVADIEGIDTAVSALDELSGGARRKRRRPRTKRHSPRQ